MNYPYGKLIGFNTRRWRFPPKSWPSWFHKFQPAEIEACVVVLNSIFVGVEAAILVEWVGLELGIPGGSGPPCWTESHSQGAGYC